MPKTQRYTSWVDATTLVLGTWSDISSNNRPTLWPFLTILPVCGSYTVQPLLEKYKFNPSSHNWLTDKRFKKSLGIRYVSKTKSCVVEINPIWLTYIVNPSAVWILGILFASVLNENNDEKGVKWL